VTSPPLDRPKERHCEPYRLCSTVSVTVHFHVHHRIPGKFCICAVRHGDEVTAVVTRAEKLHRDESPVIETNRRENSGRGQHDRRHSPSARRQGDLPTNIGLRYVIRPAFPSNSFHHRSPAQATRRTLLSRELPSRKTGPSTVTFERVIARFSSKFDRRRPWSVSVSFSLSRARAARIPCRSLSSVRGRVAAQTLCGDIPRGISACKIRIRCSVFFFVRVTARPGI